MNNIIKLASMVFISGLISCGSNASDDTNVEKNETATLPQPQTSFDTNSKQVLPVAESPVNKVASTEIKTGKINPAHGQPGHVCEIGVGEIIPDKFVAKKTTEPTITTAPIQSSVPQTTTIIKQGLNPAHGQPGHRCDISVGAPLTAVPAAKSSTEPAINYPVSSPLEYKPNLNTDTKVAAGLNPAHGQPGHRCEIAVGAPLNKKADN